MNKNSIHGLINVSHKIRKYQFKGINFLYNSISALLADEMGLGKTVQAAVAIQILIIKKICNRILIVSPTSLCNNWEKELNIWAPSCSVRRVFGNFEDRKAHYRLPFNILICSYEQVRSDIEFIYSECKYDLVLLDEAQRIKNSDSNTALACRQLDRQRSWALTGTPIENKKDDLVSVFSFIKPSLLNIAQSRQVIHKKIEKYFLRRRKKDVLKELPPIIINDILLELGDGQREAYDDAWINSRDIIKKYKTGLSSINLLSLITKLKIICNYDTKSNESVKIDAMKVILEDLIANKNKVIVFSQYVETLKKIKISLSGYDTDIYHGGLTLEKRNIVISKFKNYDKSKILLMSLKAGGVGLNLNEAETVILFDRWWNPAVEEQAINRAHRFNKKKPLLAIKFLVKDTVEEKIDKILKEKQHLFDIYVEKAPISDISPLCREDLLRILSLDQIYLKEVGNGEN